LNKRLQEDLERERKEMDQDSGDDEEKRKKHDEFVKKRKQHYNEKLKIREALHKKLDDDI
jgi:protein phosphatase inhibitor 2